MALQPLDSRSWSSSTLKDGLVAVDQVKMEPQEDSNALLHELEESCIAHA